MKELKFVDDTKIKHDKVLDCEKGYASLPEAFRLKMRHKPSLEAEGKKHTPIFAEKYAKKHMFRIK